MLTFLPYQQLDIATQTWVIYTNLEIYNEELFARLQCLPVHHISRSTAHRMKVHEDENIPDGAVVFMEYSKKTKGTPFKPSTNREMRNCSTIIMKMRTRFHNIKISRGGSFQMTGIKDESYAIDIMKAIWSLLHETPTAWTFQEGFTTLLGYMTCRMFNVSFAFKNTIIDLQKLNHTLKIEVAADMMQHNIQCTSTYEPSIGHVSSNIKIFSNKETINDAEVIRISAKPNSVPVFEPTNFGEYLERLPRKIKSKKICCNYQNSFLVFSTGRIIMSGKISTVNREDSYDKFCTILSRYGYKFLKVNNESKDTS